MSETCEMIAERLWNRGWNAIWTYLGGGQVECRLIWRHVANPKNPVFATGNSLLLALEHARDRLDAAERNK
jgi:hypothetical protein